jgi:hypothetical protein
VEAVFNGTQQLLGDAAPREQGSHPEAALLAEPRAQTLILERLN